MGACLGKKTIITEIDKDELDFISVKRPLEDIEREFSIISTNTESCDEPIITMYSLSGRTTDDPLDSFINAMEKSD